MYETSVELRELQLKCVEILKVVDNICRENSIHYSLCGGSVVGAHLYKKVIPWDDDVDLMMTRKNYEKFVSACQKELPDNYCLQNYKTTNDYKTLFSKIVDKDTTLIQYDKQGKKVVNGVFLDITVYDKVPKNALRFIDFVLSDFAQKLLYCDMSADKSIKKYFLRLLGNHCSPLYLSFEKIFKILGRSKCYSYCELYGAFCTKKMYDADIFESYDEIEFEGAKYMIVKEYMKYLETRYERTNFYEPEEKQVPPHYAYIDLNKPYLSYQEQKNEN